MLLLALRGGLGVFALAFQIVVAVLLYYLIFKLSKVEQLQSDFPTTGVSLIRFGLWSLLALVVLRSLESSYILFSTTALPLFLPQIAQTLWQMLAFVCITIGTARWLPHIGDRRKIRRLSSELSTARAGLDLQHEGRVAFVRSFSFDLASKLQELLGVVAEEDDALHQQIEELSALISDYFGANSLDSNAIQLQPRRFSLRKHFDRLVQTTLSQGLSKDSTISLHVQQNLPETLLADVHVLEKILLSLRRELNRTGAKKLLLSIELESLTARRARVRFRMASKVVYVKEGSQSAVLSGSTLKSSKKPTTAQRRLKTCAKLIRLMGGSLEINLGNQGEGEYSFVLSLRHFQEHNQKLLPAEMDQLLPIRFKNLSVLVVEDNRFHRVVASRLLKRLGCTVELATDGLEGYAMATRRKYDVILMDWQMPRMDGIELTKKLRQFEATKGSYTPIIALTANRLPQDREQCLAAGMDDFLAKPLQTIALARALALQKPEHVVYVSENAATDDCRHQQRDHTGYHC